MKQAPETPTTAELRAQHGITPEIELAVLQTAADMCEKLNNHQESLIAIIGGCAMTDEIELILQENDSLEKLNDPSNGLRVLHRLPFWKPRTNPDDWHGLETSDPEAAYKIAASLAGRSANYAAELAFHEHIERYGPMMSFMWIGSRNNKNEKHILELAQRDPKTPLGVKNGMDGSLSGAIETVDKINYSRQQEHLQSVAPAVLIYRGGDNAKNPEAWEDKYLEALQLTEGKLIVDVAHGSEIAHDGSNLKSVNGQIMTMRHVLHLAEEGHAPAGIMIEASDIDSPTDPVMPLQIAIDGVRNLQQIKLAIQQPALSR